ncbi:hypothetical protein ASD08_16285 [Streptomyces sp. Root369]|nr:hypothetical protein ASD08_16285 [Streptomyces sp. Root369]
MSALAHTRPVGRGRLLFYGLPGAAASGVDVGRGGAGDGVDEVTDPDRAAGFSRPEDVRVLVGRG